MKHKVHHFIAKHIRRGINQHLTPEQLTEIREYVTGKRTFLSQNINLGDVCRALIAATN